MDIALLVMLDMFMVGIWVSRLKAITPRTVTFIFGFFLLFHLILGLLLSSIDALYIKASYL